jgi:chromosome partitioning protein
MITVAFFNNKGGVGITTLAYHLAAIMADQGKRVLAVDLDPQANLSSMFLPSERLEELWPDGEHTQTIYGALRPIIRGIGDVATPHVEEVFDGLGLIVGDLALSTFEDKLSDAWLRCHNQDESAYRIMTAFYRAMNEAAREFRADWIFVDIGPNLGAINRSALIASDNVIIPLSPDLFSLQGLKNLGPTLREWRSSWDELRLKNPDNSIEMPLGRITPLGYIIMQPGLRDSRPIQAYQRWIRRFPSTFRSSVLGSGTEVGELEEPDEYNLGMLRHYRSLMPMAMEVRKPVFALKAADGAIGSHSEAVRRAYSDFLDLAKCIAQKVGVSLM